jgi:hypothetical protein
VGGDRITASCRANAVSDSAGLNGSGLTVGGGVRRRNRFTRPWSFRAAEVSCSPESDQRAPAFLLGLMKRRVINGGGSTRSCYRAGGISIAAMVHSYWANRPIGRLGGNVLGGIGGAVVAGMDDRRTCTVIPGSISMNRPASCPASR